MAMCIFKDYSSAKNFTRPKFESVQYYCKGENTHEQMYFSRNPKIEAEEMKLITPDSIRIVIADDHKIFRQIFDAYLNQQEDFTVAAHACNGKELVRVVENEVPDIVLTDINMPVMDGVRATSLLKERFPAVGIIALTLFADDPMIVQMLAAGADGYLLKSVMETEIVEAIKVVYNHGMYYCTAVANRLVKLMAKTKFNPFSETQSLFSEREKDIMRLICQEYSTKEIAAFFNVPVRTIDSARERIQEKTRAKNMAGIVTYAIKTGIYEIG